MLNLNGLKSIVWNPDQFYNQYCRSASPLRLCFFKFLYGYLYLSLVCVVELGEREGND